MRVREKPELLFVLVGTGYLQILKKNGISGCKNSIRFLLIFASGNLMLATNLLESLRLGNFHTM
jgi:hypothetical protein